ncbi:MAG: PTS sugar transporter subunit IIA, partial [Nevskia sp.]|nr:PTS sugar transporter subunit IIA [Nevskia sp.]
MSIATPITLLPVELIRLGAAPADKSDTIRQAAQLLVAAGCIDPAYVPSMLRREAVANTFLGHGVVIPHGLGEDRNMVRRNGIAVLQIPGGIVWNEGQTAYLAVAIAAQSDAHITILRRLTRLMQDEVRLAQLFRTTRAEDIAEALSEDAPTLIIDVPVTDLAERFEWAVAYPAGLHARPASRWVETARASAAAIQVRSGNQIADAKNLVSLLQLGLRQGD